MLGILKSKGSSKKTRGFAMLMYQNSEKDGQHLMTMPCTRLTPLPPALWLTLKRLPTKHDP